MDLASSFRHLVGALRVGDVSRVTAYLGFTIAEMANFIAILIYAYEVGGPPPWVWSHSSNWPRPRCSLRSGATLGGPLPARGDAHWCLRPLRRLHRGGGARALRRLAVGVLYVLAAVNATLLTLVRPFHESLLPALARNTEQLTQGYVAGGTIENLGLIVWPLLAGLTPSVAVGADVRRPGTRRTRAACLHRGGGVGRPPAPPSVCRERSGTTSISSSGGAPGGA